MFLPFDYARCGGTTHQTCRLCRRREPGREQWQTYVAQQMDMMTGQCPNFIEPLKSYISNNTTNRTLPAKHHAKL